MSAVCPKRMALELFKPFIMSEIIKRELAHNVRSASRFIEAEHDEVWDILEELTKKNPRYVKPRAYFAPFRYSSFSSAFNWRQRPFNCIRLFVPLLTPTLTVTRWPYICHWPPKRAGKPTTWWPRKKIFWNQLPVPVITQNKILLWVVII